MLNEFMSLEVLATFSGLVVAVGLVVQFSKSLVKKSFGDSVVRLYAFIVALVLSFIFTKNCYDAQGIVQTIINAVIVTVSAMGGYEIIADPLAKKSK